MTQPTTVATGPVAPPAAILAHLLHPFVLKRPEAKRMSDVKNPPDLTA